MRPSSRNLELHTGLLHVGAEETLSSEAERALRLRITKSLSEIVGLSGREPLLALPAGLLRAETREGALSLADELLALSDQHELTLVFGIDIAAEEVWAPLAAPALSLLFACQRGCKLLWPADPLISGASLPEGRRIHLRTHTVAVLLGTELFRPNLKRQLERAKPDALVVLTHRGPTPRWEKVLGTLRALAPLILTGAASGRSQPTWCLPPDGWSVASDRTMHVSLHRYSGLAGPFRSAAEGLAEAVSEPAHPGSAASTEIGSTQSCGLGRLDQDGRMAQQQVQRRCRSSV